jgi:PTS system N-acetylglucosamine-specific IIC component
VRPGGDSLQVVLGPIADQVVEEIRAARSVTGDGLAAAIARALEPAGMRSVAVRGSRLLVELDEPSRLAKAELDALGTRGWVIVGRGVQLIIGPGAEAVAAALPTP